MNEAVYFVYENVSPAQKSVYAIILNRFNIANLSLKCLLKVPKGTDKKDIFSQFY